MYSFNKKIVSINFLLIILLVCSGLKINAQTYHNEWITYGQDYYKFTTSKNGIYKISFADLVSLGLPTSNNSASHFQLFHEGQEMAVEIIDNNLNGLMENDDLIIFYGEKNDGGLDDEMYEPVGANPYKYYSLFTDSNAYFVTYSPTLTGKRMATNSYSSNPIVKTDIKPDLHLYTFEETHNNDVGPVKYPRISFYDGSYFFTDKRVNAYNYAYKKSLQLKNRDVNSTKQIKVTVNLSGRSYLNRVINYTIGQKTGSFNLNNFDLQNIEILIDPSDLTNEKVDLTLQTSGNRYSINFIKIEYDKSLVAETAFQEFQFPDTLNGVINVEINNPLNISSLKLYDITDKNNIKIVSALKTTTSFIGTLNANSNTETKLVSTNEFISPVKSYKRTFSARNNNQNYLIVAHPSLISSANTYATYRSSVAGGSFSVKVEDIQELYDEFFYGEKSPLAIRYYAKYALSSGVEKKNLLLLGNAVSVFASRYDPIYNAKDLVPSFSYPASDILLTSAIIGTNYSINDIPTGRVPALTNQEVLNYLNKVIKKESSAPSLRNKTFLQLIGGKLGSEHTSMLHVFNSNRSTVEGSNIEPIVTTEEKLSSDYIIKSKSNSYINAGSSLITFFGHGGYDFNDLNFGFIADTATHINNTEIFPVLSYFSCQFSNIFNTQNTISREWLLAENRGSIASFGQTTYGYLTFLSYSFNSFYSNVFNNNKELTVGEIQIKIAEDVLTQQQNNINVTFIEDQIHQTVLLGDPAVKIFGIDRNDFEITQNDLVLNSVDQNPIGSSSNADLIIKIKDLGRVVDYTGLSYEVKGYDASNNYLFTNNIPFQFDGNIFTDTLNIPISSNLAKIEVRIDPSNSISEFNETNNIATINLTSNLLANSVSLPFGTSINNLNICTYGLGEVNSTFTPSPGSGLPTYQWQLKSGTTYSDLSNSTSFYDVTSKNLKIKNNNSGSSNIFVRCKVNFNGGTYYTNDVKVEFVDSRFSNLVNLSGSLPIQSSIKTNSTYYIKSTEKINSSSKIIYNAYGNIELLPGFSTTTNTNFLAEITDGCYIKDL